MELRHLRYFIAVAEELSFTKAAQKLRLAQPSLTRQVRNLEDEIGVRLLKRANNRVALTEEGRRFLFDAKKLLALCAESVAAVQGMNRGESSELNIGYVSNIHYGLLPATLGAFRKLYPRVALNLFDMTSAEQLHALAARKLDLGFVAAPLRNAGDPEYGARNGICRPAPRSLRPRFALRLRGVRHDSCRSSGPPSAREEVEARSCRPSAGVLHDHLRESSSR